MAHSNDEQTGLQWTRTTFSISPRWIVVVDPKSIRLEILKTVRTTQCGVAFLAQGAFNKLYAVQTDTEEYIMRVSLPVDPRRKTTSEVATIAWIQQHTTIPAPKVVASKDHRHDNAIGFEWILMTRLPGKSLLSAWRSTSEQAKQDIVRRLATHSAEMFGNQREGIGNLYPTTNDKSLSALGQMVSLKFLWGNRCSKYGISRGPFRSSREWLLARLMITEKESTSVLRNPEADGSDLEDAQKSLNLVQRLRMCVDTVFPEKNDKETRPESSMLHHDDLTQANILVDNNGCLSGVVDWECVSWVPLWKACYYPFFLLEGCPRKTKPDSSKYQRDAEGELADFYWEHLMEYEMTCLRDVFIDAMQHLQPEWVEVFEESTLQRSLELAISNCDNGFLFRDINEWIDDLMTNGTETSYDLRDRVVGD